MYVCISHLTAALVMDAVGKDCTMKGHSRGAGQRLPIDINT